MPFDPDPNVALVAAYALGKMPTAQSALSLVLALKHHPRAEVREAAAYSLGAFRPDRRIRSALVTATRAPGADMRVAALGSLGNAYPVCAASRACQLLKDETRMVRDRAATILGSARSRKSMIAGLLRRRYPRENYSSVQNSIVLSLRQLGDKSSVPLFQTIVSERACGMTHAILALGEMRIASAVPSLIALLKDDFWPLRKVVAQSLGLLGDERAIEPLVAMLGDEEGVEARNPISVGTVAAMALQAISSPFATSVLVSQLKEGEPSRKEAAYEALRLVKPAGYITALTTTLAQQPDWAGVLLREHCRSVQGTVFLCGRSCAWANLSLHLQ